MIGSLRGRVISRKPNSVIIEVCGVGYEVNVPLNTPSDFLEEGNDVFLHIYTHIRKDTLQLYGFQSEDEKNIFLTLLGIAGIGPRIALSILSAISYNELLQAIENEDVTILSRIPGLGKKTAQRLILELKEKLPAKEIKDSLFEDTLSALINLGYKRSIAKESLGKAYRKGFSDIEGLLKESLKYLAENK